MDGQDLLSAALDECGLGDLFSISPNEVVQDVVVVPPDTTSCLASPISMADLNNLNDYSELLSNQPSSQISNQLTNDQYLNGDSLSQILNSESVSLIGLDHHPNQQQEQEELNLNHQLNHCSAVQSQSTTLQPTTTTATQHHIFTAANSNNTTTTIPPLQITKVKKIVIRKMPTLNSTNSTSIAATVTLSQATSQSLSNSARANIVTLTNVSSSSSVASSSSSSSSSLLNQSKSSKPLIISPQIVTIDKKHNSSPMLSNGTSSSSLSTISINNGIGTSTTTTQLTISANSTNTKSTIDNHRLPSTVTLNPISQRMQSLNNVITTMATVTNNNQQNSIANVRPHPITPQLAINSIKKTANGPIIIRTNSKLSAAAASIRQQQIQQQPAQHQAIKLVPMSSKLSTQQSTNQIRLSTTNGSQPKYQTVQFVNTKLISPSLIPNKNGTVSLVSSTTTTSLNHHNNNNSAIGTKFVSANIIKSSNNNGFVHNNTNNPVVTTIGNSSSIISNNPLITVKSVIRHPLIPVAQSPVTHNISSNIGNGIGQSTIVKLVQPPMTIPTLQQSETNQPFFSSSNYISGPTTTTTAAVAVASTAVQNRIIYAKPLVSMTSNNNSGSNSPSASASLLSTSGQISTNNNLNLNTSLLNRKNNYRAQSTNGPVIKMKMNGGGGDTSTSNSSSPATPSTSSGNNNSSLLSEFANQRRLNNKMQLQQQQEQDILLEEVKKLLDEQEEEEFANLETFNDYMPAKLKIGSRHPDPVVETASLASIPPPDVYYRLAIPDEVIDEGRLSALQLESIIYASQQHETILASNTRAGFLIGDGAGVGKGRTVAGIIYENYLQGRKRALWFSVSTDLKYDAERDLFDISATKIEVHLLNKFKYGYKIHSPENDNVKRGIIFATYNSLIGESTSTSGKYSTRFNQIIQWCGEDFDGAIIFDECHKAKNLFPSGSTRATKTGQAVLELQRRLPRARVVYASATGATEPRNMGYMTRLGIWGPGTPFEDFNQFVSTVEKRGVGAMELVAIDLKMRGMYMARQLSFKGVNFKIEHVPLSREFIRIYNCCCRLWVSAKTKFEKALDLMGADHQVSKAVWTQFWAAHQRFFKYLCIASKVKFAVAFIKESLRCNKSAVIGLQSTGEARTMEQLEDNGGELNDFVSTAKSVFQSLIEKHFPAPNRKKLAKLLGEDTSFFDQLGIKLSRNENDEIVTSYVDDEDGSIFGKNSKINRAKNFYQTEEDSDEDDDFVDVDDFDEGIVAEDNDDDDDSDMDSDDLSDIDDLMDEKLGLKRPRKGGAKKTNSLKFMDILLGPSAQSGGSKKKRKPQRKKMKTLAEKSAAAAAAKRKSMRTKYEKFYNDFDNVGDDVGAYCERLRDELLQQLESFGERLPPNTLDELIDELGGPENVAEMTGRKGRIVSTEDGNVQYEARTENDVSLEMLNLVEKQRFMDDDKRVAIISEAASSGISLHADRRAKNRWRRVHLTVELPWSADRAIQQFGRTHRSNQVSAPEYVFLISNLAGENRFASIVAKRLESLGALTHGDRRAAESRDLSQFNIDTKYGRQALEIVMKTIAGHSDVKPLVEPPDTYSGDDFFEDCREGLAGVAMLTIDRKTKMVSLDKDYGNINKFLNRLLGMEVELQNLLFRYFNQTMDAVIKQAKRNGRYDSGIIDLSSDIGNVSKLNEEKFILKASSGATKIQLHTVLIDRGLSYEKAHNLYRQALDEDDYFKDDIGFYVSNSTLQIRKTIFLAIPDNGQKNSKDIKQIFRIYKPSLGLQSKYETKSTLRERGEKISSLEEAEKLWREHYEKSEEECSHLLLFGRCRQTTAAAMSTGTGSNSQSSMMMMRKKCDVGLRKRTYCILSGSVLTVWPDIEKTIPTIQHHKLQIVRLKTDDGLKYIGPMIPPFLVDDVRNCLNNLANPTPKLT